MPLVLRSVKGSPLTIAEGDGNFTFLDTRITDIENNPPQAVGISNITVDGSQFTVWLEDATFFGPFTLPIAVFHWRGEFLPNTGYFQYDIITSGGSVYLVLQEHVTGDEFDSGAENSDNPVYHLLWSVLTPTFSTIVTVSQTQRQITSEEAGSYFRCIATEGCEIIVPVSGGFIENDEFHFKQAALSPVIFTANPGVTILPYDGHLKRTGGRGRVVTLKYVGLDVWDIFGGLAVGEDEYET